MVTARIRGWFTNITDSAEITSPETAEYNCFAWAVGASDAWWEPGRTWPIDTSTDWNVEVLLKAYETHGFVRCDDGVLQPEVEKIAIYCDSDGEPTHAAKQLPNGRWSSKLGPFEDIEHELLDLSGDDPAYGSVCAYACRPRPT